MFSAPTEYKEAVRHIRLIVEYDGTDLCGWQRQANGPTVQGHLEDALGKLLAHEVAVTGASRTDAGVHASGQVASFRTGRAIPLHGVVRGLNSLLPAAIAIAAADEVGDDFHPRFSATGKHYRYLVFTRPERSPRWRDRAWHLRGAAVPVGPQGSGVRLDLDAMREAAGALVGEHDFAAFRAAGCTAHTTVRHIEGVAIGPVPGEPALVAIDVRGNAFLRNMVRICVGTLVEVGQGRRPVGQVAEILASRDRTRAGITAPPGGLELVSVRYDGRRGA
ncbi:MAG TPA: tRNA pseudouridine(38-40) synthase TruA [Kofleriaceae bacterium]|nr:tRNA pseudouridine(38-40) synthase TruA [Kofleriaceae bacterium]